MPGQSSVEEPLWSVMIPTYNCANLLRYTLAGVLEQDPGPEQMQITVIDDCSTRDDPEAVVRKVAEDRVEFLRNDHNLGPTATFNRCIALARGKRIHILHGDDEVRQGFYRAMASAFDTSPAIGAAFCRVIVIDEDGMWRYLDEPLHPTRGVVPEFWRQSVIAQRVAFPGMVLSADAVRVVGGFDQRLGHASDWELWTRIALRFPVWYEPEPLALYRVHTNSDSSKLYRTAGDVQDIRRAIDIISLQVPSGQRRRLRSAARRTAAETALARAWRFRDADGDYGAWWCQVRAAIGCSRHPRVLWRVCRQILAAAWAFPQRRSTGKPDSGIGDSGSRRHLGRDQSQ